MNTRSPLNLQDLVCTRDERPLFVPLSLSMNEGECVAVVGVNGAGKTTMLRTLAGLHSQYSGSYECADFIYQGHRIGLDELMTPLENLAWYGRLEGLSLGEHDLRTALIKVGVFKLAMTPCRRLSQGQQRRVVMARWLLSSARLWLLDEPYTSLDHDGQNLLNEVLNHHCEQGGMVLAATHVPLRMGTGQSLQITPVEEAS